jgi:MerR family transcriptional regulator, light-induced transcriptional regulator
MSTDLNLASEVSQTIDRARDTLAEAITARHYELQPELAARYGEAGRAKCLQDARYHLSYLSEAIRTNLPSLFADYVAWAKVMLEARNVPAADLSRNLEVMRDTLREQLPAQLNRVASEYISSGIERLPELPASLPSLIHHDEPYAGLARSYLDALLRGDRQGASRLVLDEVEGGMSIKDVYLHVFQRTQHEIGRLWQMNRISVAQEHYCTAATQLVMSQLYPHIFATERCGRTLVATCVSGDLHEIGVRMVADFFEMEGWDTYYLGANVPTQSILQTLAERRADVLAASATITTHVSVLADLIRSIRDSEACRGVKILVGGYPFNVAPDLWRQIGADACAHDALGSVEIANRLVEEQGEA